MGIWAICFSCLKLLPAVIAVVSLFQLSKLLTAYICCQSCRQLVSCPVFVTTAFAMSEVAASLEDRLRDLVKVVNAWVRSAFGNVFLFRRKPDQDAAMWHKMVEAHQSAQPHKQHQDLAIPKAVLMVKWLFFVTQLGKGTATKSDEFSEKCQRGGGGHFHSKKFILKILGTLNGAFWAWNWYKIVNSGF